MPPSVKNNGWSQTAVSFLGHPVVFSILQLTQNLTCWDWNTACNSSKSFWLLFDSVVLLACGTCGSNKLCHGPSPPGFVVWALWSRVGWLSIASLLFSSGLNCSASSSSLKLNCSLFREMVIGAKFKCLGEKMAHEDTGFWYLYIWECSWAYRIVVDTWACSSLFWNLVYIYENAHYTKIKVCILQTVYHIQVKYFMFKLTLFWMLRESVLSPRTCNELLTLPEDHLEPKTQIELVKCLGSSGLNVIK